MFIYQTKILISNSNFDANFPRYAGSAKIPIHVKLQCTSLPLKKICCFVCRIFCPFSMFHAYTHCGKRNVNSKAILLFTVSICWTSFESLGSSPIDLLWFVFAYFPNELVCDYPKAKKPKILEMGQWIFVCTCLPIHQIVISALISAFDWI